MYAKAKCYQQINTKKTFIRVSLCLNPLNKTNVGSELRKMLLNMDRFNMILFDLLG